MNPRLPDQVSPISKLSKAEPHFTKELGKTSFGHGPYQGVHGGQQESSAQNHRAVVYRVCTPQALVQRYSISFVPFIGLENDSP